MIQKHSKFNYVQTRIDYSNIPFFSNSTIASTVVGLQMAEFSLLTWLAASIL